jgi:hypothetical protein
VEQPLMTNHGLFLVDGNKWNNGTSELGLTCGFEPDGTFHGVVGLCWVEHPRKRGYRSLVVDLWLCVLCDCLVKVLCNCE